jgi:hypothetical protein
MLQVLRVSIVTLRRVGREQSLGTSQRTESVSADLETLVRQAGFIFVGSVQQLGTATVAGIPAERAALVRVKAPLQAPPLMRDYVGRDVTVELRALDELRVGDEAVFFTRGWVYAQSIALRELGHRPIRGDLDVVRRNVIDVRERIADEDLRRRLGDAVAVVAGRVVHTAKVALRDVGAPEREHDPQWFEAVIAVDSVLLGALDRKSVVVLFASSRDVKWRNAPKLHVGQSGIWLLHEEAPKELEWEAFVLVDPRDSWPLEQLGRIKALLSERY